MAEENIIFNTQINTGNSATSIKSVRAELRELTQQMAGMEAGSEAFVRAAQRAGELQDRMQDAQAAVKAFNPEAKFQAFATILGGVANGFAAAQGAMSIFGSDSKELEKLMQKTQGAIALATGINGLMGMKDGFINLGSQLIKMIPALKSFGAAAVGALTGGIATAIILIISYWEDLKSLVTGTTAAVKLSSEQIAESVKKGHDEFKKAAQERNEIAKREAQTKLQGKELDLELAKIDRKNKIEQAAADGKLKDQQKLIEAEYQKTISDIRDKYNLKAKEKAKADAAKELETKKKDLDAKIQLEIDKDTTSKDALKKLLDDRLKLELQGEKKSQAEKDLLKAQYDKKLKDAIKDDDKRKEDERVNRAKSEKEVLREEYANRVATNKEILNDEKASYAERIKALEDLHATGEAIEINATEFKAGLRLKDLQNQQMVANTAMQGLNDLATAVGANAETMKGIAIAQTTIDTYYAAQTAFLQAQKNPISIIGPAYPYIMAGAAIASGLARVASIARTNPKGGGGGGAPSGGGGGAPSAPALPPPSSATRLTNGNEPIITRELNVKENRVYVLEKDITKKQDDVAGIVNKATIQ